jgi:hypothetical protein
VLAIRHRNTVFRKGMLKRKLELEREREREQVTSRR